jgi:bla regulator protein blaR1
MACNKLVATMIGAVLLSWTVFFGLMDAPLIQAQAPAISTSSPSFEVASIKPNRAGDNRIRLMFAPDSLSGNGISVKMLIGFAYNLIDFQISGGPGWIDSERYDIEAKMNESTIAALKKLTPEQAIEQRLMVQSLLAERFNLKVSHSSKELPIYALVVAKNGPKMAKSADAPPGPGGPGGEGPRSMMSFQMGELTATAISMSMLADRIARGVGRNVVDKTGLEGRYDFTLHWTSGRQGLSAGPTDAIQGPAPSSDSSGPSIYTALQEQLGLKLESQKGPVETLVIESIEKPSEN